MGGDRRRSLPTIDVSPSDSDVEIVPAPRVRPVIGNTDGPSMAAFPLTRASAERKFWSGPPEVPGEVDVEIEPEGFPSPPRRRGRSLLSKVLFLAVFVVILTLLACEISIAFKVPWLDPRPRLLTFWRLAVGLLSKLRGR